MFNIRDRMDRAGTKNGLTGGKLVGAVLGARAEVSTNPVLDEETADGGTGQ